MKRVKRALISQARRNKYKETRIALGYKGCATKGWLYYLRKLSPLTTMHWQKPTLEETTVWMFMEWQRLCREDQTRNRCHMMVEAVCTAFGVAKADIRSSKREAVIRVPRVLAMLMLSKAGFKHREVAWSFNRTLYAAKGYKQHYTHLNKYLEFLDDQDIGIGRFTLVGQSSRSLSHGVHGRAGSDSSTT